jgi:hypothetical protein
MIQSRSAFPSSSGSRAMLMAIRRAPWGARAELRPVVARVQIGVPGRWRRGRRSSRGSC